MADGTTKPIADVQPGDKVLATDPETGRTEGQPVLATITGEGQKDLVDVSVDTDQDGQADDTVTATAGHPFWVAKPGEWRDAGDLRSGDLLRTAAGTYVQITAVAHRTAEQRVHNLNVSNLHTYYVLAGTATVLVHNCTTISAETRQHVPSGVIVGEDFVGWHLHPDQTGGIPDDRLIRGDLSTNADGTVSVGRGLVGARLPGGELVAKKASVGHTFFPSDWTADDVMEAGRYLFSNGAYKHGGVAVKGVFRGVKMSGFLQKTADGTYTPSTFFPTGKS